MGYGKFTPLTKLTPLKRQSPNIVYVIMSGISALMPNLVEISHGVTSPHYSQSYHLIFFWLYFLISLYANFFQEFK